MIVELKKSLGNITYEISKTITALARVSSHTQQAMTRKLINNQLT